MATFNLGRTQRSMKFAGKLLEQALKRELEGQGHVASGALLKSIKSRISTEDGAPQLLIDALDYALDLNAERHPNPTTSTRILTNWLKTKNLGVNLVTLNRIAYAIGKSISLQGTPTGSPPFSGAWQFSNNGRRTN